MVLLDCRSCIGARGWLNGSSQNPTPHPLLCGDQSLCLIVLLEISSAPFRKATENVLITIDAFNGAVVGQLVKTTLPPRTVAARAP